MTDKLTLLSKDLESTKITNDVGTKVHHLFEPKVITAINAAIAVNRPLLIWGETGIGKSQLAKAVAKELKRVFIPYVCDVHTESRDLLWHFDAVSRLAEAQIQGSLSQEERDKRYQDQESDPLAIEKFIVPQALWWALNWDSAEKMSNKTLPKIDEGCSKDNGTVVLIDEIDKVNADVPNGLLEALGNGRFHPQGMEAIEADKGATPPLVIVATNGERNLPDAFIRRCLSLHLDFPSSEEEQRDFLIKRGKENFPTFADETIETEQGATISLLEQAANFLIADRKAAKAQHLYPLCGQAEFFDLLRGIKSLHEQGYGEPTDLINELHPYIYNKLRG